MTLSRRRIPHTNSTVSAYLKASDQPRALLDIHMVKPVTAPRECLSCEEFFESEGRHHRICALCKDDESWKYGATNRVHL